MDDVTPIRFCPFPERAAASLHVAQYELDDQTGICFAGARQFQCVDYRIESPPQACSPGTPPIPSMHVLFKKGPDRKSLGGCQIGRTIITGNVDGPYPSMGCKGTAHYRRCRSHRVTSINCCRRVRSRSASLVIFRASSLPLRWM